VVTEIRCERDDVPTALTCVQCGVPICPSCLVRTPVGLKCPTCGGTSGGRKLRQRRAAWLVPLVVAVVALAIVSLPQLVSRSGDVPATQTPTAEEVQGPDRFADLGEEARDGSLAFKVLAADCGATRIEGGTAVRVAQGVFCQVSLTVRNDGRNPSTLRIFFGCARNSPRCPPPAVALTDGQSRQYEPDAGATQAHPANAQRDLVAPSTVNPGNELSATLVFDIPPGVEPVTLTFRASPNEPGAIVRLRTPPS
jgi:hypothetical protein